jgi:hypothetical protein
MLDQGRIQADGAARAGKASAARASRVTLRKGNESRGDKTGDPANKDGEGSE